MSENKQNSPIYCLTGAGGKYEVSDDIRKLVCFTDRGELYVSSSHERSAWVLAFIDKLRRDGVSYTLKLVSMEHIALLYSHNLVASNVKKSNSNRQDTVIKILTDGMKKQASDIHIIVRNTFTKIKFRIDGELHFYQEMSETDGQDLCATIYQTMCDVAEPIFNPRRSQDARLMTTELGKLGLYGGRIATRPTDSGLLMVIRILYDRGNNDLKLEHLGYTEEQIKLINRMAARRFGINILSGPTGSGKSTTLECILKRIISHHQGKSHILTLEDPPEYRINGAIQTPILCAKDDDDAVSREWARAISNAMRLDPDILMCGEIRDFNSATATFRAAMTGHGVWTTLHSNDALSIMTRLQDIGVSASILNDSTLITGLISQVLTRKLCPNCKIPYQANRDRVLDDRQLRIEKCCQVEHVYLRGPGCSECNQSGIKGRTVVAEVIEPDAELMDIFIRKGKTAARRYWIEHLSGVTKNKILINYINQGIIDPADGEKDVCMLDDDELILRRGL